MENRIKDQQLSLFADRTPARMVGQSVASDLIGLCLYAVRAITNTLKKTPFARMSPSNLRLKLIKVGAVIIRNTGESGC